MWDLFSSLSETQMFLVWALCIAGFYMAWSIGANDVANAMGTSVGSHALTLRQAVVLAAIFEFSGAFFFGSNVAQTVQKGIVNPDLFGDNTLVYIQGMLSSLLAAGVWLQLASYFGWPVSTTQSIVGAIIGFGWIAIGPSVVDWWQVGSIVLSWALSPLLGGLFSFYLFSFLRDRIFYSMTPLAMTKRITPVLVFFLSMTFLWTVLVSRREVFLPEVPLILLIAMCGMISLLLGLMAYVWVRSIYDKVSSADKGFEPEVLWSLQRATKHLLRAQSKGSVELGAKIRPLLASIDQLKGISKGGAFSKNVQWELESVEAVFGRLQVLSACMMAFAHGANDVANAIGPLTGSLEILLASSFVSTSWISTATLWLGGVGIVVGLATWGWRVIVTVGKKITELTPTRGFAAELGAAMTVLMASRLGLPVSATHTLVGSILGVGMARGIGAINLQTTRDILASWVITVPAGALLSVLFFSLLDLFQNPI